MLVETDKEAKKLIINLILKIQPQAKAKYKATLSEFAKFYFSQLPAISDEDFQLLLFGDKERRGLLVASGSLSKKTKDLKPSSVVALELILLLLDTQYNERAADRIRKIVFMLIDEV